MNERIHHQQICTARNDKTKKMIWVERVMTTMELRPAEGIKNSRNVNKWVKVTAQPLPHQRGTPFHSSSKVQAQSLTEDLNRGRNALLGSVCLESPGFILEQTWRGATGSQQAGAWEANHSVMQQFCSAKNYPAPSPLICTP